MSDAIRFVLLGNDECLKDPVVMFLAFLQHSLHLSAETADLQKSHYLSMCFLVFVCLYSDLNIKDSVFLLHFPLSKVSFLDSLRFGRLCSLFSASFVFSLFIILCFSAALLSFWEASASETLIAIGLCNTLKAS